MLRRTPLLLTVFLGLTVSNWTAAIEPDASASVYGRPAETAEAAVAPQLPRMAEAGLSGDAAVDRGADDLSPDDPEAAARAERIITACITGLARESSISARMRQRVRVGDQSMVGAGLYLQAGLGEDQRYRFESSLAADPRSHTAAAAEFFTVETLEVLDGASFWTYRRWGENPVEVHRVDVARVRQRVETVTHVTGPDAPAITQHIGGVPRILAWLREWFVFTQATSAEIDGMPVWLVEGQWIPAQAKRMFPEIAEQIQGDQVPAELLPDGVPWRVRLSIGKRELFPFRIEYLAVPGERPVATREAETVGVFELYDVRLGEPVDQTAFIYSPASNAVIDTTEGHIGGIFGPRP
jgi:hypothetical protein